MQFALSSLGIHTGISRPKHDLYFCRMRSNAGTLTYGQVYGAAATSCTAYNYNRKIQLIYSVKKIGGAYILGFDDMIAPAYNLNQESMASIRNQEVQRFLKANVAFNHRFHDELLHVSYAFNFIDKPNQQFRTEDVFWEFPNLSVSVEKEDILFCSYLLTLNQPIIDCYNCSININNVLCISTVNFHRRLFMYQPKACFTPAAFMSPYEFDFVNKLYKNVFDIWYKQATQN